MKPMRLAAFAMLVLCASAAEPPEFPRIPPKTPAEAAASFRVLDGFRMELLAAEPLVGSPVAMACDENGRAYVCEMRDYPYTDKARHKPNQENPTDAPIGRVRLLEDSDGDGVFDKATVFADSLSWPTGVACWKGGVFVAATPDIWYLKDTDGDGVADVRRKVFTGFRKLNVQAVMNNLVWGLDNRIHGAGGSNGGEIRALAKPDAKPLVLSRSDFAFDPETETLELLSGGARFGATFDDWGNRFLCNIRNPAQHVVLPARYLARNQYLGARSPLHDMAESGDQLPVHRISAPEPWRVLRAKRWAGERDMVMPRSELVGAGVVTSASGVTSYRGAAYPEPYRGNVFVCESAANLFYRLQLAPDASTFKASRVDGEREMVASTDSWFRPVNFINAPDGTLHVLDMYRENIEHPWSIPDDIHAAVDLEAGRDMGRLWRLAPPGFKTPAPPRLGGASVADLVTALENPNSWWRETAQRLLVERQDKSATPALREMLRSGRTPQARLHAMWTLEGLRDLSSDDIIEGLRYPSMGVRTNALILAEVRLDDTSALREAVLSRADDPDAAVRLQAAFTLGEMDDPRAMDALVDIARRDAADPWIRAAVLSAAAGAPDQLLARALASPAFARMSDLVYELARVVGARGKSDELSRVLLAAESRGSIFPGVLTQLGEGLRGSGKTVRKAGIAPVALPAVTLAFDAGARVATDEHAPLADRVTAIALLATDEWSRSRPPLASLLDPRELQEVQRAAVAAVASFDRPEATPLLLSHWKAATPQVRADIVLAMLANRSRLVPLLEAVERGEIPGNQIPFARRPLLLRHRDARVKELAARIFGDGAAGSRAAVVAKYRAALALKGDAARGRKVFDVACAACHRAGDLGTDVGPNLASIRGWSAEQVLVNILDPNREVAPNFVGYLVEMKDGRTLDGMIAEENASSLTLSRAGGVQETVLRRDVAQITGLNASLMPEGLEASITIEQMADLLAFLRE